MTCEDTRFASQTCAAVFGAILGLACVEAAFAQQLLPTRPIDTEAPRPGTSEPSLPNVTPDLPEQLQPPRSNTDLTGKSFKFVGNSVFTDDQLRSVIAEYIERPTIDKLERARLALTRFYIDQGYVNSGVVISTFKPTDDLVEFKIIEGRLNRVRNVTGDGIGIETGPLGDLHPDYIRSRLTGPPEEVLNVARLEERFRVLLQDPMVEQLNGALIPGDRPGDASLDVKVVRAPPLTFFGQVNNYGSPTTGTYQGTIGATLRNSTGFADSLTFEASGSHGRQSFEIQAETPISSEGVNLFFGAAYSQTKIVAEPLDVLDIRGKYYSAKAGFDWQPYNSGSNELNLSAQVEYQRTETTLLGERFSFSPGVKNGATAATVLRLSQDFVHRGPTQAFSLNSTFNVGLNAFGTTQNSGATADALFASWLGQLFYVKVFEIDEIDRSIEISFRTTSQIAFDSLLPFEQVSLAGRDSVRGFDKDGVIDDNMAFAEAALRVPIIDAMLPYGLSPERHTATIFARPFVGGGIAWPYDGFNTRTTLVGTGLDFEYSPRPEVQFSAGFGVPIYSNGPRDLSEVENFRAYFQAALRF